MRIYFLQHWFRLSVSDPGAEEALYDSEAMRHFVGIDLGEEPVPDESTILNFRHLIEQYPLGDALFREVNKYLEENSLKVWRGIIVDTTIISVPISTKNQGYSTRKGNQRYFEMKARIGVDSQSKLIHSVAATVANTHDSQLLGDLLHGEETRVWRDSAYSGQADVMREHAPKAKDCTNTKGARNKPLSEDEKRNKPKVRSKIEHPFLVMKRQFGFTKVRLRGVDKNAHPLFACCALVNLVAAKKQLLRLA